MGMWKRHKDTVSLRSGFPLWFLESEERAAKDAEGDMHMHDPDGILGIRRDLRHHKVYTIDGVSTLHIDDGISVEVLDDDGMFDDNSGASEPLNRCWIHIVDVDRWSS